VEEEPSKNAVVKTTGWENLGSEVVGSRSGLDFKEPHATKETQRWAGLGR